MLQVRQAGGDKLRSAVHLVPVISAPGGQGGGDELLACRTGGADQQ
jgi:hypothetical protein